MPELNVTKEQQAVLQQAAELAQSLSTTNVEAAALLPYVMMAHIENERTRRQKARYGATAQQQSLLPPEVYFDQPSF